MEHPVVRVHPETGRKGIFVSPGFTWRVGDVAVWDNRSTAHYANREGGDAHRVMHRITLRGDRPYGPGRSGGTDG
ncbi:TauD/TfdA family dioxygenase [Microbispora sp. ZYX-F-249]|uniref:TauD/TfdA family dioxygenase n=1 Tax=Microbispora maris TaxID=3144104 RepID=A0ABV0ASG4_9ACTN